MKSLAGALLILTSTMLYGQVFTNKEVGKKNQAIADSLKKSEYPYSLPIWGDKATKAGYDLPYSAGLSAQYFTAESDILIDNLSVGFNNGPMYDLDGIVRFDVAKSKASSFTFRPDVWLFPFLNIYGILGKSQASTQVGFGIWAPNDDGTESELVEASTTVEFNTTTFGLGFTPTIGVGGGFLALDINVAWTDVPQLSQPARSFVFGPRFGKNFKLKKPGSSVAVWVGGFRVDFQSQTDGSLPLSEVVGPEFGQNIDDAQQGVADRQQQVESWWNGLTPLEQANPVNQAKYDIANATLGRVGEILAAAETAADNIQNATVQYSMDKQVKDRWNFIVGGQYQFSKHLMVRVEYGFLGSRTQLITGVQYRFGL
ncbi:hypothetical protein QQ054_22190 [Oscillatoria amoena NRMC-F 0135]|nr:hypothetical protein [Oscillatoria amoena NRMC-F 0135]